MSLPRTVEMLTGARPAEDQGPEPGYLVWLRRASPREGWITYVVLLLSLLAVVQTVNLANWVRTPSLMGTMFWATAAGLALSKVRLHGALLLLAGLVLGAGLVYWQSAGLAEGATTAARFGDLNHRLVAWWGVVLSDDISADLLPFGLVLAAFTWIVGFAAAWSVFRFQNVWGAIIPSALGLIANMSYLPDRYTGYLFLYLFFAALLLVRMSSLERQRRWERRRTPYPQPHGLTALLDGAWFTLAVFLVAVFLPASLGVSSSMRDAWNQTRSPVNGMEQEMSRLLSQVPSKRSNPMDQYGLHLPFQGPIRQTPETVFTVQADFPLYWRMRVYATYSPSGWVGEKTERHELPWVPALASPSENRSRIEVPQEITPSYPVQQLAMGTTPLQAAQPLQVEVFPPKSYTLDAAAPRAASLPADLQSALGRLRTLPAQPGEQLAQALLQTLPESVVVTAVSVRDGANREVEGEVDVKTEEQYPAALRRALPRGGSYRVSRVSVTRKVPYPSDTVSVLTKSPLDPGETYAATTWVSVASVQELSETGTNYPGWVLDRYLQLPSSFSARVAQLAAQVSAGATSQFDKATALEDYLRNNFTYRTDIAAPPPGADGVEHFLFSTRTGYSDYFASAMVLMARSVGLPARLVVGFAPGAYDAATDRFVVKGTDSHAWVEVYFPGYGWIEFEPTPGKGQISRGLPLPADEEYISGGVEDPFAQGVELPLDDSEPVEASQAPVDQVVPGGAAGLAGLSLAGVLALAAIVMWFWYRRVFVHVSGGPQVYERMAQLGRIVGLSPKPQQTPREYARSLGAQFPSLRDDFSVVANVYAQTQYGRQPISDRDAERTVSAWRRIRRQLSRRFFRR